MSGNRNSKWNTLRNVRTTLRPEEGQTRGWESQRQDYRPAPRDPPPISYPAYGNFQQYPSGPGSQSGVFPWNNPPIPPPQVSPPVLPYQNYQGQHQASPQGSPPLPHNQNYQGQLQAGSGPQGYGGPPASHLYQPTQSHGYGQNQGYFSPQSPVSYSQYHPGYGQQPSSSGHQSYHGVQGAHAQYYNHTTQQQASNSYSPPHHPPPDRQNFQGPSQSPNFGTPPDHAQSSGGSLGQTVTGPPDFHCEHRDPGNGV